MRAGIPRVAAVNDLSGFGRCSLTVALPLLSAMGFQVCPVPTAILSAHTGYEDPCITDFTRHMPSYLRHWQGMGLDFDGVYTGFLGNESQAAVLEPLLAAQQAAGRFVLVDPAMGDHGCLYATCTPALVGAMARLISHAAVTTPNLTEACLLTDTDYDGLLAMDLEGRRQAVTTMAGKLLATGCGAVVVTGLPLGETQLENGVFTAEGGEFIAARRVPCHFAGTGDVFASVLCGYLLRGETLTAAVAKTADFVSRTTAYTVTLSTPDQDGIAFEPFMGQLCL